MWSRQGGVVCRDMLETTHLRAGGHMTLQLPFQAIRAHWYVRPLSCCGSRRAIGESVNNIVRVVHVQHGQLFATWLVRMQVRQ